MGSLLLCAATFRFSSLLCCFEPSSCSSVLLRRRSDCEEMDTWRLVFVGLSCLSRLSRLGKGAAQEVSCTFVVAYYEIDAGIELYLLLL